MRAALIVLISAILACALLPEASAQQPTADQVVSAKELTREQFKALPASQLIDFGNERITKGEFLDRIKKAIAKANKNLPELKQRLLATFAARHKEVVDRENAVLAEGNKKVQVEIARLVAADADTHGPNWEARRRQAVDILEQAERTTPEERSTLEKKAADLLAPTGK
jgi:hypothetical protein